MSVPPHIENNLRVWMLHFIQSLVLGGRDVNWCLDLCYLFLGVGGSVVLKLSFVGGGDAFTWNSQGIIFY